MWLNVVLPVSGLCVLSPLQLATNSSSQQTLVVPLSTNGLSEDAIKTLAATSRRVLVCIDSLIEKLRALWPPITHCETSNSWFTTGSRLRRRHDADRSTSIQVPRGRHPTAGARSRDRPVAGSLGGGGSTRGTFPLTADPVRSRRPCASVDSASY